MIANCATKPMMEGEILRVHNSSFVHWFKTHIDANPPPIDTEEGKLILALSYSPATNLMTYQAYDINGYTFYTEEKDKSSQYQKLGGNHRILHGKCQEKILRKDRGYLGARLCWGEGADVTC